MSRGFQAVLTAACFAVTTLAAPSVIGFGVSEAQAATTVKSSKSNTSDRMGGGGGKGAASRMGGGGGKGAASRMGGGGGGKGAAGRATTVKSSKSNTSDRIGLPGFGAGQLNPQPEPPGRAKAR